MRSRSTLGTLCPTSAGPLSAWLRVTRCSRADCSLPRASAVGRQLGDCFGTARGCSERRPPCQYLAHADRPGSCGGHSGQWTSG
eukprot:5331712-Prymnesium_polylepis.1